MYSRIAAVVFHKARCLTIIHRLVITASAHEFAPQSRSGNRALEISVAEDLINKTGPPIAAQLHDANHSTYSPYCHNFSSNLHINVQSTPCAATLSARFWARKCRLVWKQRRCPACSSPAFFSNLDILVSISQKTRPDALAFLSDFVIDAVVDQFAREVVLECTRERSRQALYASISSHRCIFVTT